MTTRYQKTHYEDVARILRHERDAGLSGLGSNMGSTAIACVMLEFSNLFAADNPPTCRIHGIIGNERKDDCPNDRGFNREKFLTACGLESGGSIIMDRAPEDIRRADVEAEYRQLEAESLVEAQRDREMFEAEGDESLGRDE